MGRNKSGLERVVGGLTTGALLYILWAVHVLPVGWVLGLGFFFAVVPVLSGLRQGARELTDRGRRRREALENVQTAEVQRRDSLEKTVLQVARQNRGVVSPALVALDTDLKLEEAEKVLEALASRGYAEMRVKDNGTIDYVFHDLK